MTLIFLIAVGLMVLGLLLAKVSRNTTIQYSGMVLFISGIVSMYLLVQSANKTKITKQVEHTILKIDYE